MKVALASYEITLDIFNWAQHVLPDTSDEARLIRGGLSVPEKNITIIPSSVEKWVGETYTKLFYKKYGVKDFILNVGHIGIERKNA